MKGNEKKELITLLENANYEKDKAIKDYLICKDKLDTLQKNYNELNNAFIKQKNLSIQHLDIRNYAEKKFKEQTNQMIALEKKLSISENSQTSLKRENNLLAMQVSHFKSMYEEFENRQKQQLSLVENELKSQKEANEILRKANSDYEGKVSELLTKLTMLKNEKEIAKNDANHLTKIIEDSNITVKAAEAKSKEIDKTINFYKKQVEDAKLENEKLKTKLEMLNEAKEKQEEEFNVTIKEKNELFNNAMTDIKDRYERLLNDKTEEANMTKGDFISIKIERDKYFSEWNILRKEFENLQKTMREENEKNFKINYEEKQSQTKTQNHLKDRIKLLSERNEQLEKENRELAEQIKSYNDNERKIEQRVGDLAKNEEELMKKISQLKEDREDMETQKKGLEKMVAKLEMRKKLADEIYDININAKDKVIKDSFSYANACKEKYDNINKRYEDNIEYLNKMGDELDKQPNPS